MTLLREQPNRSAKVSVIPLLPSYTESTTMELTVVGFSSSSFSRHSLDRDSLEGKDGLFSKYEESKNSVGESVCESHVLLNMNVHSFCFAFITITLGISQFKTQLNDTIHLILDR